MKILVTLSIAGLIFNPVEVVDTFSGRDMHSSSGAAAPQDVVYVGEIDRLLVANGTDGKLSGHAPACGMKNETGLFGCPGQFQEGRSLMVVRARRLSRHHEKMLWQLVSVDSCSVVSAQNLKFSGHWQANAPARANNLYPQRQRPAGSDGC